MIETSIVLIIFAVVIFYIAVLSKHNTVIETRNELRQNIENEEKKKEDFMVRFREVRNLWFNGLTYSSEDCNPFSYFDFKDWRKRLFYIESLTSDLNYRYCKRMRIINNSPVNYPDELKLECNQNINEIYGKFLHDKNSQSLNIKTCTQLEWIEWEYINYLYNCYVYHKIPLKDNYMYDERIGYTAYLKNGLVAIKRFNYNNYLSKYPLSLFIKNMLKHPSIKQMNLTQKDLEKFYDEHCILFDIPLEPIKCFSCFKDIYECLMELREEYVIDTFERKHKEIMEIKRKEYIEKKKELNRKKPKRNRLNNYIRRNK